MQIAIHAGEDLKFLFRCDLLARGSLIDNPLHSPDVSNLSLRDVDVAVVRDKGMIAALEEEA